jgi:hypothetical protein
MPWGDAANDSITGTNAPLAMSPGRPGQNYSKFGDESRSKAWLNAAQNS